MICYLDIETLPTNDPSVIAQLEKSIKAPATYKKPESIQAWLDENKDQALKELLSKTSFNGLYGRIACVCWSFDNGEVLSSEFDDSERMILERLNDSISDNSKYSHHSGDSFDSVVFCGHNIAGFDLPFLWHRSVINDVKPIQSLGKAMKAKPWDNSIADTMLMWSSDKEKRVSMDKLCAAFGIEGKGDFDGSMVADTWPTDPQKVIEYCKDDVRRTREIYKRLSFA